MFIPDNAKTIEQELPANETEQEINLLAEKEVSFSGDEIKDFDITSVTDMLMGNLKNESVAFSNPVQNADQPAAPQKQIIAVIDKDTANFAAEMYVSVLTDILDGVGEHYGGTQKKYAPGSKFMDGYKKITSAAIEAGELTLPTPLQMFYISTFALLAITAFNSFSERKKTRAKRAEKKRSESIQEQEATTANPIKSAAPKMALVENESKRGKFKTEDGFYVFDMQGKYIPKSERFLQPSEFTKKLIDKNLSSQEIKTEIQKWITK